VPLATRLEVSLVDPAEVMDTPGAKRSRHVPQFVNQAASSELPVAPTVIASATRAGEVVHGSTDEFPAAIA